MIFNFLKNRTVNTAPNRVAPVVNASEDEATIYVYDEIWRYGINAKDFVKELNGLDASTIHLRIDSPGGDVFAARAMQTAINQHEAKVIAHIDGLAASAATFLAMGADEIEMVEGGFFMIHNAATFVDIFGYFQAGDMENLVKEISKEAGLLKKVDMSIANDYVKKTGKKINDVTAWMDETTWFTAQEAIDAGLIDRIYDGNPVENKFDLSGYKNVPERLTKTPRAGLTEADKAALLRRLEVEYER